MRRRPACAIVAASSIAAGMIILSAVSNTRHYEYKLVDEALIIVPVQNQEFVNDAVNLYLDPSGFDGGTVSTLNMPEVVAGGTLDDAVNQGVQQLVTTVETDYNKGDMAGGPMYIFGYSQSSDVMGMAEQQLADDGIPKDALNFVMVGDSASTEGGFLNSYVESLPAWEQPYIVEAFNQFGAGEVLGLKTRDNLYPTEVYSLSGDGWSIYDHGMNDLGMYSDHLEYLGLTSQEIATAGPPVVDGLTEYFTIPDPMVNSLEALWTQFEMAISVL